MVVRYSAVELQSNGGRIVIAALVTLYRITKASSAVTRPTTANPSSRLAIYCQNRRKTIECCITSLPLRDAELPSHCLISRSGIATVYQKSSLAITKARHINQDGPSRDSGGRNLTYSCTAGPDSRVFTDCLAEQNPHV